MKPEDCRVGQRVSWVEHGLVGSVVEVTDDDYPEVRIKWDTQANPKWYHDSVQFFQLIAPAWKVGQRVQWADPEDEDEDILNGTIQQITGDGATIYIKWDGDDTHYNYSSKARYLKLLEGVEVKETKRDDAVYRFFATCTAHNSCSKCSAPLPCRYHGG